MIYAQQKNLDINHVSLQWTKANKITVTQQKSPNFIIPREISNTISKIDVTFNHNTVVIKDSVKYLGITLDKNLNFDNSPVMLFYRKD